jgi:hypothetical protein
MHPSLHAIFTRDLHFTCGGCFVSSHHTRIYPVTHALRVKQSMAIPCPWLMSDFIHHPAPTTMLLNLARSLIGPKIHTRTIRQPGSSCRPGNALLFYDKATLGRSLRLDRESFAFDYPMETNYLRCHLCWMCMRRQQLTAHICSLIMWRLRLPHFNPIVAASWGL